MSEHSKFDERTQRFQEPWHRRDQDDAYVNPERKGRSRRPSARGEWNQAEARYGADEFGRWNGPDHPGRVPTQKKRGTAPSSPAP